MARVTIGVPVYNGGALLAECLECLRTQTFEDIEVLIGDNCSNDGTGEIARDFAARDTRFRHIRRPENIGVIGNFQDLCQHASSDLFCWRAHDDLSAPDFVEQLVGLLDARPDARLAICRVETVDDVRKRPLVHRAPRLLAGPRMIRIQQMLFSVHASWIYGLWHRATLAELQRRVHKAYRHFGGWDDIALFALIVGDQIVGTNRTSFTQRVFRAHLSKNERLARRPSVADLRQLRSDFRAFCVHEIESREWTALERRLLDLSLERYVDRRGYSRAKLRRRSAREGEGLTEGSTLLRDDVGN